MINLQGTDDQINTAFDTLDDNGWTIVSMAEHRSASTNWFRIVLRHSLNDQSLPELVISL